MSEERIVVWDWAVRLVHWAMVLILPLMWWTAEQGWMDWHRRLGLTLFTLVVFRLAWGIAGSWTARFVPMLKRLGAAPAYARHLFSRKEHATFGHSPVGSLAVFAMLLALCTQIGTGLFAVDVDGLESGPLSRLISFDQGRQSADIHEFNFNIVVGLVALHLVAVTFYVVVLRDNLIGPMVSGRRPRDAFSPDPLPKIGVGPISLLVSAGLAAGCLYAVLNA